MVSPAFAHGPWGTAVVARPPHQVAAVCGRPVGGAAVPVAAARPAARRELLMVKVDDSETSSSAQTAGSAAVPSVTASGDLPSTTITDTPHAEVATTDGSVFTQATRADGWLESVRAFKSSGPAATALSGAAADAVAGLGTAASEVLSSLPPPRREEAWRFTDLNALYKMRFDAGGGARDGATAESLAAAVIDSAAATVIIVDGIYQPQLSTVGAAVGSAGVYVGPLAGYAGDAMGGVLELLTANNCETDVSASVFTALNGAAVAAGTSDVVVVVVPAGSDLKGAPVQVVFSTTPGASKAAATAAFPRLLVHVGDGATVEVVEQHVGASVVTGVGAGALMAATDAADGAHLFSDALTTVQVGKDARVSHTVVNEVPAQAVTLSNVYARAGAGSTYGLTALAATGAIGRVTFGAELLGEGAHVDSTSLCLADGTQVNDLHSRIEHVAPGCTSNQLHKNVAAGRGRAIFAGKVVVAKPAQQTDSKQLCRSLLLSNRAQVDAMPVLLINADDVKCTHGATVSDLNEDEVFYCQSRGLSANDARFLLVKGFAGEIIDRVAYPSIRDRTTALVRSTLDSVDLRDSQFATHSSI